MEAIPQPPVNLAPIAAVAAESIPTVVANSAPWVDDNINLLLQYSLSYGFIVVGAFSIMQIFIATTPDQSDSTKSPNTDSKDSNPNTKK